ncbi:MAG: NifB/NifX family molybdenum-iron cluster-binding protein [Thermofilum sp.]
MIVAIPVLEVDGEEYVAPHLRFSRRIVLYEVDSGGFRNLNSFTISVKEDSKEMLEHLVQHSVDLVVVYEADEELSSALAERGVRVYKSRCIRVSEVLKNLKVGNSLNP